MAKITKQQKQSAVEAIRIMLCEDKHAQRLVNFIAVNYRIHISLSSARRMWRNRPTSPQNS